MYVKPVDGRQVPDPERGGLVPTEGAEVPRSQYWIRRLADGDVIETAAAAPAKSGKKEG